MTDAKPHRYEWNEASVARFWGWMAQGVEAGQPFFAEQNAPEILRFAREITELRGARAVDFGTGPGHLLSLLLGEGARCGGIELSEEGVDRANERLANVPGFDGVALGSVERWPFDDGSLDVVFALEVVEHLLAGQDEIFFGEAARVIRPGGTIVLSTPNAEDLAAGEVLCPGCGATFHRMQHVRSWDAVSLSAAVERHGFETVAARPAFLDLTTLRERALLRLKHLLRFGERRTPPNLLYAGRRV